MMGWPGIDFEELAELTKTEHEFPFDVTATVNDVKEAVNACLGHIDIVIEKLDRRYNRIGYVDDREMMEELQAAKAVLRGKE